MRNLIWENQGKMLLSKVMIDNAKPHSVIFASEGYIEHPWFNNATISLERDGVSTPVTYVVYRGVRYKLVGLGYDKLVLRRIGIIENSRKYIKVDESECTLLVISTPEGNIGMEAKHPSEIVYH